MLFIKYFRTLLL